MTRAFLATFVAKLIRVLLRAVRRNASQLPGRLALSIDKNYIEHQAAFLRGGSVVVCGTNGKTTTNNIVAETLEKANKRVVCNKVGANMAAGIASALVDAKGADIAVLELDELSCKNVVPALKPRYFLLLNLFRDQLDRAGEIDKVQDTITQALKEAPDTHCIVLADDPLAYAAAKRARGENLTTFGIKEIAHQQDDRVPEARFCQYCGDALTYRFRVYAQLGDYYCPRGDFSRPSLDFAATHIMAEHAAFSFTVIHKQHQSSGGALDDALDDGLGNASRGVSSDASPGASPGVSHDTLERDTISAPYAGTYMIYNLLGAFALTHLLGVSTKHLQTAISEYHPQNGRLQQLLVEGRQITLNLAKNPTGFNQNISLVLADERQKAIYFVINDNYNDGRDISWIYDVDFERLQNTHNITCIAGGSRAHDVQVRLKYAGINASIAFSAREALDAVPKDMPLYVLTNYSALWLIKDELERMERKG